MLETQEVKPNRRQECENGDVYIFDGLTGNMIEFIAAEDTPETVENFGRKLWEHKLEKQ